MEREIQAPQWPPQPGGPTLGKQAPREFGFEGQ